MKNIVLLVRFPCFDGTDFLIWQRQVGNGFGSSAAALNMSVPEPTSFMLASAAGLVLALLRTMRPHPGIT